MKKNNAYLTIKGRFFSTKEGCEQIKTAIDMLKDYCKVAKDCYNCPCKNICDHYFCSIPSEWEN